MVSDESMPGNGRHLCNLARNAGLTVTETGEGVTWTGTEAQFRASGLMDDRTPWQVTRSRWVYPHVGMRGNLRRVGDHLELQIEYFHNVSRTGWKRLFAKAQSDAAFVRFMAKTLEANHA